MSDEFSITEQRTVEFYGTDLTAVRADDGQIYAGINQMCDALGIDAQGQRRRMERHAVLSRGLKGVDNLSTPGGIQSGYVLRVDLVPLWLSGIRVSAIREDARKTLERFQEQAAAVLWEAFQEGRLTADEDIEAIMSQASPDAVEAYQLARALVKLARNQIYMEARVNARFDRHEHKIGDHDRRLELIESELGNTGRAVTQDQAMQISQAVKAVAMASPEKNYGRTYGEIYRRYGVTSYKLIPAAKFDEVMAFLTEWYQKLTGDETLPF